EAPGFASCDVSFISIRLILPRIAEVLLPGSEAVVLVKPQFEAGRNKIGKNGVVRDKNTHREVLSGACDFAVNSGFTIKAVDFSPITGPKGNIEFLMYLALPCGEAQTEALAGETLEKAIADTVLAAHETLD
ncbi:MAG: TlyA family RNA methyltransferase, partial [Clostridia bacterium]|nr:TlyA family RNA methyltransferase [Clostridia bacterium]